MLHHIPKENIIKGGSARGRATAPIESAKVTAMSHEAFVPIMEKVQALGHYWDLGPNCTPIGSGEEVGTPIQIQISASEDDGYWTFNNSFFDDTSLEFGSSQPEI